MNPTPSALKFKDIILVVHGIGDQDRYATVRSVATRLAGSKTLLRGAADKAPVAPQPLGYFHSEVRSITSVRLLDDAASLTGTELASIGFAEVYWADIPRKVVKEGHTLEETKAWAHTVVARAEALCERARTKGGNTIVPPDFNLAGEVLDDIIETVYVLENLLFLAQKAGFFRFDLRQVLEAYLGDVQVVAEFDDLRANILSRFHRAMENVYEQQCQLGNPEVRLHIVAHSEGTVVSFLGMLHAMSGAPRRPAEPAPLSEAARPMSPGQFPCWLKHVQGFMTIGSPIDKHLLLWPRLWKDLDPARYSRENPGHQIRWRNYYDYGDPVGFKLDSVRLWLKEKDCHAFEFCGCPKCQHDVGFARYLLPGEAHNEYWNDAEVFEDFVHEAVQVSQNDPASRAVPRDKPWIAFFSPVLPYVLSFVLLLLGTFVLYKAVHAYTHPSSDPLQRFVRFTQLGVNPPSDLAYLVLFKAILGIAGLVAGTTLLARFPRLACGVWWKVWGFLAFLAGGGLYALLTTAEFRNEIGEVFHGLRPLFGSEAPTLGILLLAFLVGLLGYLGMFRRHKLRDGPKPWLLKGMRPLIFCGAVALVLVVACQMFPRGLGPDLTAQDGRPIVLSPLEAQLVKETRLTSNELRAMMIARGTNWGETLKKVQPILAIQPPAWPVVLAGALFLYLWWFATLLFDLAFVWHRCIRRSITNDRLREWTYGSAARRKRGEAEPCNQARP